MSLQAFLRTYFPAAFPLPFCADHLRAIAKLEQAFRRGGLFAVAMPRGSGKTTIVCPRRPVGILVRIIAVLLALWGRPTPRPVPCWRRSRRNWFSTNYSPRTFPRFAIRYACLKNNARLCTGQLWDGKQTLITWSADRVVFPTIPKIKVSGATLSVAGLTGALRGQMNTLADGTVIRPEVVVLDDPQTAR